MFLGIEALQTAMDFSLVVLGGENDGSAELSDRAAESRDAFVASGGTIVELSAEERAAWANAIPNIAAEWAAELDGRGEPGSEMLNAYLAKLAAAGYSGVRDWGAK